MILIQGEKMIAHIILGILLLLEGLSTKEKCRDKLLYVEDITQNSAMLYWKDTGAKEIKDYKVLCAGVRQYMTVDGIAEVDLDAITQFVPHRVGHAFLSQLQSNFKYSCAVQSESMTEHELQTRPLLFSTPYSVPEVPNTPVISSSMGGKQIDILLFPTSTKYGPIDGYEVQFHIIDDDTAHVHGQPYFPHELTKPKGLLTNIDTAQSSKHPLPFCIAFRNGSLPSHITISDNLLQGAIHSHTIYTVIIVAYTDDYEQISRPLLYSLSQPSESFTLYITSNELQSEDTTTLWLENYLLKCSMVIGLITSTIILIYFLLVGCCILYIDSSIGRQPSENEYILQKDRDMLAITSGKEKTSPAVETIVKSSSSHVGRLSHSGPVTATSSVNKEKSYLEQVSLTTRSTDASHSTSINEQTEKQYDLQQSIRCDESTDITLQLQECASMLNKSNSAHKTDESVVNIIPLEDVMCEEVSSKTAGLEGIRSIPVQPNTQMIISEILKKAQQSTETLETSSHSEEWLPSNDDKLIQVNESHQSVATNDTMQSCGSSLVFIPRGLSHSPLSIHNPHSTPEPHVPLSIHNPHSTPEPPSNDLAPDMEMDLYGISYSLDDQ